MRAKCTAIRSLSPQRAKLRTRVYLGCDLNKERLLNLTLLDRANEWLRSAKSIERASTQECSAGANMSAESMEATIQKFGNSTIISPMNISMNSSLKWCEMHKATSKQGSNR